jgi:hypothetical protein
MLSQPRAGKSNWCHGINRFIHQLNTLMTVLTLTAAITSHGAHDSRKADREKYKAENGLEQIRFAAREVTCRAGVQRTSYVFVQHSMRLLFRRRGCLVRCLSSIISFSWFLFPAAFCVYSIARCLPPERFSSST